MLGRTPACVTQLHRCTRWRLPILSSGRWYASLPYQIVSHTALQRPTLREAVEECVSKLPTDKTPSLVALVVSHASYRDQLQGVAAEGLLPQAPTFACFTDQQVDPITKFLLGIPEDQSPAIATLTALYLPPDHLCCPFFSPNDAVPSLRVNEDTKMPLGRYLGKQGERLNFLLLTSRRFESSPNDAAFQLHHRLRTLFPNGDVSWLALVQMTFLVHGQQNSDGIAGLAISCPDTDIVAEFILQMFSHFPTDLYTMSRELFSQLVDPSTNRTLLTGEGPSLHDTLWRGMYTFVVGELAAYVPEVVHIAKVDDGLACTKVTGDPYVPAGEVTWVSPSPLTSYGQPVEGHIQVAEYQFTNSAFLQATITRCNPFAIEVGFSALPEGILEGHQSRIQKTIFTSLAWEHRIGNFSGGCLPLFHFTGALVLPGGYTRFHIFELRYRRMLRKALETGSLIGVVDWTACVQYGLSWAIGVACRVVHCDFSDSRVTPIVVQGVSRFRMKSGGGTISDFGLQTVQCVPYDDNAVGIEKAAEGWDLANQLGKVLRYNPMEGELKDCAKNIDALSQVSFILAGQAFDDLFCSTKPKEKSQAQGKPEADKRMEFIYRMVHTQCPLSRLKVLLVECHP